MKIRLALSLLAALLSASMTHAGYVLEVDTDGADDAVLTFHPNFSFGGDTTTASQSSLSTAVGLTGGDSIFGGNGTNFPDTYVYTYTPSVDGDNNATNPVAGEVLNQFGVKGSLLTAGESGSYDIYATWPYTNNVSGGLTTYTLSDANGTIASVSINQNAAAPPRDISGDGVPEPGSGSEWIYLFTGFLDANTTYTLVQEASSNTFVSTRSAGILFDRIPEPSSMLLACIAGIGLVCLRRYKNATFA